MTLPRNLWESEEPELYDAAALTFDDEDTTYDGVEDELPRSLWANDLDQQGTFDSWDDVTAPIDDPWDSPDDTWDSILDE